MLDSEKKWITVVSGLPRSGTSMMMRMLERGGISILQDGVRSADQDNPHGYFEFERVKQLDKDSSWLDDVQDQAVKIIYVFLHHLPQSHNYKVIFMRRSLEEVISSQKTMLRARKEQGGALTDQQLMYSFERQLQKLYAWLRAQNNFQVLYLDHHYVLEEPDRAAAQIDSFLGLQLDTEAMARAVDSSLHRTGTKRRDSRSL